jgi:hypothetical protein
MQFEWNAGGWCVKSVLLEKLIDLSLESEFDSCSVGDVWLIVLQLVRGMKFGWDKDKSFLSKYVICNS